jgi:hypothetical protein
MPNYCWQESYRAAVLESDWTNMEERVRTAEAEIHDRRLILSQDHGGTLEEREALVKALGALSALRLDAAVWLEKNGIEDGLSNELDNEKTSRDE